MLLGIDYIAHVKNNVDLGIMLITIFRFKIQFFFYKSIYYSEKIIQRYFDE